MYVPDPHMPGGGPRAQFATAAKANPGPDGSPVRGTRPPFDVVHPAPGPARRTRRRWLALLLSGPACGTGPPPLEPAPETRVEIAQGELVGMISESGAQVWRGVPYAASTAGAHRWRAPQPAVPWDGVRRAIDFAERCPQLTGVFDEDEGLAPGQVVGSEDCLALDIYAPPGSAKKSLPVMVWIHGGGNVWGRSSAYDGSRLALHEDVLIVAVQYRLGPLGWFSHPLLRATAATPEGAAAAFTTLDLIASLRWVRENIAAFGGDPGNVTVFGESAGGHNVVSLLASPLAEGLFHRAIIQSGSFSSVSAAEAEGRDGELLNPSAKIASKLRVDSAQGLRAASLDDLFAAYTAGSGFLDVPRVIQDGVVLPASPLRSAFASTDTFHAVPVLLGSNRDEMKLFYLRDERLIKMILGVLPVARDQARYDALTGYLSRLWRIRSVEQPAAMMTEAGHDEVFVYRFDWDDGGSILFTDFKKLLGAAHGFELPFVFNRFQHLGDADRVLFEASTLPDREYLSRAMGGYWASFARDGVPSSDRGPQWPASASARPATMRFDTDPDGGMQIVHEADTVDALVADMLTDSNFDSAERCEIVDEMDRWMFSRGVRERLHEALDCLTSSPDESGG